MARVITQEQVEIGTGAYDTNEVITRRNGNKGTARPLFHTNGALLRLVEQVWYVKEAA